MKRLVLFVEGEGDAAAVPVLVKRILTEMNAWDVAYRDDAPFRVGAINKLMSHDKRWPNLLLAALEKRDVGGVLLVLDGDIKSVRGQTFSAATVARDLAQQARQVGAGAIFSTAVVFACFEFESWLIAGVESLAGNALPDGRHGVKVGTVLPGTDLERTGKGWLSRVMHSGYKETIDQAALTQIVDLNLIRSRSSRSFMRFESAVGELVDSIRTNAFVSTPVMSAEY